jgi:hypothetical protein
MAYQLMTGPLLRSDYFAQVPVPALASPPRGTVLDVLDRFEFDRASLRPFHTSQIIEIARRVIASQTTPRPIRSLLLIGHTDPVGTDEYNDELGCRRARAVRRRLLDTINRMQPGVAKPVLIAVDTRGEKKQIAGDRERSRRVQVIIPAAPPLPAPACEHSISSAVAIEMHAAQATLTKSVRIAQGFVRTVGSVGARGTIVPTLIDDKYWFAKLYELITYYEIGNLSRFAQPAFLLHFIPIFYDMYADALDNFLRRNLTAVSSLWLTHFQTAARPDVSSFSAWQRGVQSSIATGVSAHIQGDMATALERTYRSFVAKYCLPNPPLDTFRRDFFQNNRPIFNAVQAALFLELSRLGPFPVSQEMAQSIIGVGAGVLGGLDLDEVFRWRATAWDAAKARLGQP